jgi:hypothetical protein
MIDMTHEPKSTQDARAIRLAAYDAAYEAWGADPTDQNGDRAKAAQWAMEADTTDQPIYMALERLTEYRVAEAVAAAAYETYERRETKKNEKAWRRAMRAEGAACGAWEDLVGDEYAPSPELEATAYYFAWRQCRHTEDDQVTHHLVGAWMDAVACLGAWAGGSDYYHAESDELEEACWLDSQYLDKLHGNDSYTVTD